MQWKLPFGSSVESDGIRFRIWAPDARQVSVVIEGDAPTGSLMQRGTGGFHHAFVAGVGPGTRYRFSLDGELFPIRLRAHSLTGCAARQRPLLLDPLHGPTMRGRASTRTTS